MPDELPKWKFVGVRSCASAARVEVLPPATASHIRGFLSPEEEINTQTRPPEAAINFSRIKTVARPPVPRFAVSIHHSA